MRLPFRHLPSSALSVLARASDPSWAPKHLPAELHINTLIHDGDEYMVLYRPLAKHKYFSSAPGFSSQDYVELGLIAALKLSVLKINTNDAYQLHEVAASLLAVNAQDISPEPPRHQQVGLINGFTSGERPELVDAGWPERPPIPNIR